MHAQASEWKPYSKGGQIPEPLLETTFTLLDSVMYSRISRGLGGLIFPPSSQPEEEETGQGEREKEESVTAST